MFHVIPAVKVFFLFNLKCLEYQGYIVLFDLRYCLSYCLLKLLYICAQDSMLVINGKTTGIRIIEAKL